MRCESTTFETEAFSVWIRAAAAFTSTVSDNEPTTRTALSVTWSSTCSRIPVWL